MVQILVTKPGALNAEDREALRQAGVVAVEAESPSDVKIIAASGAELSGSAMLYAAMRALNTNETFTTGAREAFAKAIMAELQTERDILRGDLVKAQPRGPGGKFSKNTIAQPESPS